MKRKMDSRINKGNKLRSLLKITGIVLAVLFILWVGWIITFLIFINASACPRQREAKENLQSLYAAQMEYFNKYQKYASHSSDQNCFELLNWRPKRLPRCNLEILEWFLSNKNKYTYYCDTAILPALRPQAPCHYKPPEPSVTDNSFTIFAIGNIDSDPQCDVWSINDGKVMFNFENDV